MRVKATKPQNELALIRERTYKPPPEKRCETCKHWQTWLMNGGESLSMCGIDNKKVSRSGVCDLWEGR